MMEAIRCKNEKWLYSAEAFALFSPCMYRPTYDAYRAFMDRIAATTDAVVYVCRVDGIAAGMLALDKSGGVPEIAGIAVSPRYQRQGVGRYLIYKTMEAEGLTAAAARTDDDAVEFYRRCGFSAEKEIRQYPDGVRVRYLCRLDTEKHARAADENDGYSSEDHVKNDQ